MEMKTASIRCKSILFLKRLCHFKKKKTTFFFILANKYDESISNYPSFFAMLSLHRISRLFLFAQDGKQRAGAEGSYCESYKGGVGERREGGEGERE